MCEYQRVEENKPPMCEYTKDLCTYCVLGNGNTYKEAEKALKELNKMREILFRGKRKDSGEWVHGNFVRGCEEQYAYIVEFGNKELCRNYVEVIPETVGQYTGELDKNGTKIFEGDIVDVKYNIDYVGVAKERIGVFKVVFHNGCFMKAKIEGCGLYHFISSDEHTVIGNVYDNPELLKER